MKALSNKTYDILKYLTIIVLPAIGALYTGLSQIWDLPYAAQIPATIRPTDTIRHRTVPTLRIAYLLLLRLLSKPVFPDLTVPYAKRCIFLINNKSILIF